MAKDAPVPGQGDIEIILSGKTVILRPSLNACIGVSRLHRSAQITAQRVMDLEFDTITEVIALGLGQKVNRPLQQSVYETGLTNLAANVIKFIGIVNNGGKPFEEELAAPDGDADEDKSEEGNPERPL